MYSNTEFTFSSKLECPDCKKIVHVGTGGHKNLDAHRASKACQTRMKANCWNRPSKPNQSLDAFLKPQVPLNPSTISAPSPVHPAEVLAKESDKIKVHASMHEPKNKQAKEATKVCQKAVKLLRDLEAAVERIPDQTPRATQVHRLSVFAVDPHSCIAEPGEDDWAIVNGMLKTAFGWGEAEMAAAIPEMLNKGDQGLDGFIRFMTFFIMERGLEGALFETKVEALIKELHNW